jgi:DNA-binding NtrC family response regulator
MRGGAIDYLSKPIRQDEMMAAIARTQRFLYLQRRLKEVEAKNSLISKALENKIERQFIGISPQITEVYEQAITAAKFPDANVFITGESGTGKENIARIIHYSSARKSHLFCAVNSSAITDTLLESEFFGHKKGSFTGAISDKIGFFEVSNKGTLFLDEIGDMPIGLQSKILRAAEEKVITRVGDTHVIHTDFRIISATNQDIEVHVAEKKFRLDLLHRLNTLHIHIPALRERPEDIKPLLIHFVEVIALKLNKPRFDIDENVFELLEKYDFPGNVRELKNLTERALILSRSNTLRPIDFPIKIKNLDINTSPEHLVDLRSQEIKLIRKALQKANFNQSMASDLLGITRDALIRKIKKHNIIISRHEE